jgi:hypothetical protein
MMFNHFSSNTSPIEEISMPTASMSSSRVDISFKKKPPVVSPTRSDTTSQTQPTTNTSSKLLAWMIPMKRSPDLASDASSIASKKSSHTVDELVAISNKKNIQRVDAAKLYDYSTKDLHLLVSMSVFFVPHDTVGEKMISNNGTTVNGTTTVSNIGTSSIISSNSTTVTSVTSITLSSVLDINNSTNAGNSSSSSQKIKVSDIFDKNATTKMTDKDR